MPAFRPLLLRKPQNLIDVGTPFDGLPNTGVVVDNQDSLEHADTFSF